ncbi:CBS domain-containing protein [Mariprofundus sp. NF]|uniref:CBS domain-containing protein n=1 Tax=Mariprofundus sp. NF TaxID=2608716 RepID=UPI0015A16C92|nr:CBS domain-containing protein [Mariprofundus sp. NF]NWF37861.1 CBS domain-containing protein [Mariprofundus sp. NF]
MTIQLVGNIMSREVITAHADMRLSEILTLLSEHNISFVVLREGSKPVGVITERDIVHLTAENLDTSRLTARDVMSSPVVVSSGCEVDIAEAYHRLKLQNKRHLVIVTESGDILGVVTLSDFIKHLGVEAFIEHKPLNHVLTSSPTTVEPGTTALQAIRLMDEQKISCIIIAEQGKPVGILTERDVARISTAGLTDLHVVTIGELMTQPVVVAHAYMNTSDASKLMRSKNIRHLIVVDDDGLIVGVVTETNIVRGMEGRYVQSLVELLDEKEAELRIINEELEARVKERTKALSREIKAHKAIQSAMHKLTQALEQAGEAVLITDRDGCIEYVNEAFVETTGYTLQEVQGKNPSLLQSGRQDKAFYELMWRSIVEHGVWKGVVWNRRKSGDIYPEQLHIRSIRGEDNRVINYVGTFSDITEKMAMEAEYRHAQRIEAVGALVGGVAHNFNNILAGLGGNLYLAMQKAETSPELLSYLRSIEDLTDQASEMVRQLLTFARKEVTEKKSIALTPLMRETLKTSRMGVPESIQLSGDFCDESLSMFGDATQLQQVLMNMINNARDAIGDRDTRTIAVALKRIDADDALLSRHEKLRERQLACLTIEDSGEGIAEDVLEHVFEPFYSTKEVGKGTGLGLSMSKGSIESHGGVIEVESTPGKGTRFAIYLPLLANSPAMEGSQSTETLQGDGQLILLVDDDPVVLDSAKGVLEILGYRVLSADDGEQAFDLFLEHLQDLALIMTDVVMPNMGGHELAQKVRQHSAVPIIFMTGYDYEQKIHGSDALMATISKPFNVQKLSLVLSDFLNG